MLALRDLGYEVAVPFGENTRYDLVIGREGTFKRVQCKTGRLRDGSVIFNVCSTYGHHLNPPTNGRSYHGEVDAFSVWCRETSSVYLIPIKDLPGHTTAALRVAPTRNHQRKGIRFASDYEIGRVALA